MQLLEGSVRNYSWGSTSAIPELMGKESDGRPVAEVWFGAHPVSPSTIAGERLNQIIDANPQSALGARVEERFGSRLPFLLKLLAADEPLSLQAHPTLTQAQEGFERENSQGVALDATERNYKDASHKPELIVALTNFHAMAGFRPLPATRELFALLRCEKLGRYLTMLDAAPEAEEDNLRALFTTWITIPRASRIELIDAIVDSAKHHVDRGDWMADVLRTVIDLNNRYPGDVGVLGALLLNHVHLVPGEAMFLQAGQLHAYISGLGVEIMANSDNVLRGGLTSKYVDVPELVRVLDFESLADPRSMQVKVASDIVTEQWDYPVPVEEFGISRIELAPRNVVDIDYDGPVIVLCTAGAAQVTDPETGEQCELRPGRALWIPAADALKQASGLAEGNTQLFVARA